MVNDLISVIVPVYNVESYLERCLESIISQTYQHFEIILINDGSTDHSRNICELYSSKYYFITLINKANEGLSEARNIGLSIAKGDWIYFIDSDDWIANNVFELLISEMKSSNCEIVIGSMNLCSSLEEFENTILNEQTEILGRSQILNKMTCANDISFYACNSLYKKYLFEDIKYPYGKNYEDLFTTYKLIDKANSIAYVPNAKYAYFQREDSIVNRGFNSKQMNWYDAVIEYSNFCENNYPELILACAHMKILCCVSLINKIVITNKHFEYKHYIKILKSTIKSTYRRYITSNLVSKANTINYKIASTLIILNVPLYKNVYKIFFRRIK